MLSRIKREGIKIKNHIFISIFLLFSMILILAEILHEFTNLLNHLSLIIVGIVCLFIGCGLWFTSLDLYYNPKYHGYLQFNIDAQRQRLRHKLRVFKENNLGIFFEILNFSSSIILMFNLYQIQALSVRSTILIILILTYTLFYGKGKDGTISGAFKDKGQRVTIICILAWYLQHDNLVWFKIFIFCFETDVGIRGIIHLLILSLIIIIEVSLETISWLRIINFLIFFIYNEYNKSVNGKFIDTVLNEIKGDFNQSEMNVVVLSRSVKFYNNLLNYDCLNYNSDISLLNELLFIL